MVSAYQHWLFNLPEQLSRPGYLPGDGRQHSPTRWVVLLLLVQFLHVLNILPKPLQDLAELLLGVQRRYL